MRAKARSDRRLVQLGGVWLPLPHLLMVPFVQKMEWWQSGLAGMWPSLACYILGVVGFYRLCRRMRHHESNSAQLLLQQVSDEAGGSRQQWHALES